MKQLIYSILAATLALNSCQREAAPQNLQQITGNWALVQPSNARPATLTIEVAINVQTIPGVTPFTFSGRAAVNQYTALGAFINGTSAESGPRGTGSLGAIGATKMGGSPAAMQAETEYFQRLAAVTRAELYTENRLRLHYPNGALDYERR